MEKVIYSKSYPKLNPLDRLKKNIKPTSVPYGVEEASNMRRRVLEETGFRDIRGRREGQILFIDTAIQLCNDNMYTLEIEQTDFGLWATIYLDWDAEPDVRLNALIGMSDRVMIRPGEGEWDVTIILQYCVIAFTHDGVIGSLDLPDLLVQPYSGF